MSNPDEIDHRVAGTELEKMIGKDSPDQRNGVLGSLGLIADSFRLLPTKKQAKNKEWSATGWAEKREGWIFLTGTEAEQEALRPLHSLWIDLLILRLLTQPKPGQKRAWFVLDELATLQRLPQFHSALTKGRKSDNPIIFGYQGKAQLEVIYGHLAEVMLSQPATKFVMKNRRAQSRKVGVGTHWRHRDRTSTRDRCGWQTGREELHHGPADRAVGHEFGNPGT